MAATDGLYTHRLDMAFDPVRQLQLSLWRAGHVLNEQTFETTRLEGKDDVEVDRLYERGRKRVANLAVRIESTTGCTLESRRVLDFGCGVGRIALALADRCEHVYGLDVSPAVLRAADRAAKHLNLTNVEWLDASCADELAGSYDMLVSFYVFQHIPSREGERIFAKLVQGLRPGGVAAVHFTIRPSRPRLEKSYPYMVMNSYSLNRLGRLLAMNGVFETHVRWSNRRGPDSYEEATLVFRKD